MLVNVLNENQLLDSIQSVIAIASTLERLIKTLTPAFFTEKELIEKLKLSRTTLWRYRRYQALGYSKVGRRIYYTLEDVMKMLRRSHFSTDIPNYFQKGM